jgi:hypothetical protein
MNKKKNNHYSRKQRQLRGLIEQLRLKSKISNSSTELIHRIKLRIKFLLNELSGFVSKYQLKKMLGGFAIVFGFSTVANTQVFTTPLVNPFGLTTSAAVYLQFPEMADLDNDGDMDLLLGAYAYGAPAGFTYYENTGSPEFPSFGPPVLNPFGLTGDAFLNFPALVDLDNDGDLDLLSGEYYGTMSYYENTGTASAPTFEAPSSMPFGLSTTYGIAIPTFADLDGDGDMDLLVSESYANMQYFENIGTAEAPSFDLPQQNPFGLAAGYGISSPEFGDFDNDGDQDIVVGVYYGDFEYYLNTGSASNPNFFGPATNPFGLTQTYEFAFPASADLDGDGDLDLLVCEAYGTFQYFENVDPTTSIEEIAIQGKIFPNPFADVVNFDFDIEVLNVEVLNLAGQVILSIENPGFSVDVSALPQGSYIVKCRHKNQQLTSTKLQKL